jgi:hypothetical protein
MTKNSDSRSVAEDQNETKYFQEEHSVTRRERFVLDGAWCLERANRPVDHKNDL